MRAVEAASDCLGAEESDHAEQAGHVEANACWAEAAAACWNSRCCRVRDCDYDFCCDCDSCCDYDCDCDWGYGCDCCAWCDDRVDFGCDFWFAASRFAAETAEQNERARVCHRERSTSVFRLYETGMAKQIHARALVSLQEVRLYCSQQQILELQQTSEPLVFLTSELRLSSVPLCQTLAQPCLISEPQVWQEVTTARESAALHRRKPHRQRLASCRCSLELDAAAQTAVAALAGLAGTEVAEAEAEAARTETAVDTETGADNQAQTSAQAQPQSRSL